MISPFGSSGALHCRFIELSDKNEASKLIGADGTKRMSFQ